MTSPPAPFGRPALLVLDFDGTMTDAEAEGAPFHSGYLEDLAALVGHPIEEIRALAGRFEAEVAAAPDSHGWLFDGRIVAPAGVDPYLRMMPVARRILDHCGAFRDAAERGRLLDDILYKYNYQKTAIAFRPGALAALTALSGTRTFVVTNSHTEPVQRKIKALAAQGDDPAGLDWLVGRVHGTARKFVIDDGFADVPAALELPGLGRPVLLRRRRYHEVLSGLLARHGLGFADLMVIGDIFELDLALPLALGARVGLVVNHHTPAYERSYVAAHPRGLLIHDLAQIPVLLQ